MDVLSYFQNSPDNFQKFSKSLRWALYDKHFWVRREAVKLFKQSVAIDNFYFQDEEYKSNLYPGVLDLFLELPQDVYNMALESFSASFTPNDLNSLNHYVH